MRKYWDWLKNYFPRIYIPARRTKEEIECAISLKRQAYTIKGLLDAIAIQNHKYENMKDEAVAVISCLVMKAGGEVSVSQDIVEAIHQSPTKLAIDRGEDGSLNFKLEEISAEELAQQQNQCYTSCGSTKIQEGPSNEL